MKKLYEINELLFAIVWMVIYCVLQSLANPLNEVIGTPSFRLYMEKRFAKTVRALQISYLCQSFSFLYSLDYFRYKKFQKWNGV